MTFRLAELPDGRSARRTVRPRTRQPDNAERVFDPLPHSASAQRHAMRRTGHRTREDFPRHPPERQGRISPSPSGPTLPAFREHRRCPYLQPLGQARIRPRRRQRLWILRWAAEVTSKRQAYVLRAASVRALAGQVHRAGRRGRRPRRSLEDRLRTERGRGRARARGAAMPAAGPLWPGGACGKNMPPARVLLGGLTRTRLETRHGRALAPCSGR